MKNIIKLLLYLFIFYGCSEKILDTESPVVTIISPQSMITAWDTLTIECEASDNKNIKFLELWVNGKAFDKIYNEPYQFKLYVNQFGHNSLVQLQVLAYDKNGNGNFSEKVTIRVDQNLGSKILYISANSIYQDLYIMDIDGQKNKQVTHKMNIDGPAYFSIDGRKITFWDRSDGIIYIVDADGSNLRSLFKDNNAYLARLSSATNFLYYDHKEDDGSSSLYFYDISRRIKVKVIDHWNDVEDLTISPDGQRIFFIAKNRGVYLMDWDGKNRVEVQYGFYHYPIYFSPSGLKIIYSYGDQVYTANSTGNDLKAVSPIEYNTYFPAFSPDEEKIVFATGPPSDQKSLCIMNSDGSNLETIYSNENHDIGYPQFTDDQSKIIFEMDWDIYSIKIDGSGLKKLACDAYYAQLKPFSRLIK